MEKESTPAKQSPLAILGSLGESIIDEVHAAMASNACNPSSSTAELLSSFHPIKYEESSLYLSIHSANNSCKISVRSKPDEQCPVRQDLDYDAIDIKISRGTIEITKGRTVDNSLCSSWMQRWYKEDGLSTSSSPLGPVEILGLVTKRLEAGMRGFKELLQSKIKGENNGFPLTEVLQSFYALKQMKGALSGGRTGRAREKRKRGWGDTVKSLECCMDESSAEYVEVLEKLKKIGCSEEIQESEYLEVLKKMKNLMD